MVKLKKLKNIINKNYKLVVLIFFIFLITLGLCIFKDYGISTDEPIQIQNGLNVWDYITNKNDAYIYSVTNIYGPVFDILVAAVIKILNFYNNQRMVFLTSHFLNFLLFCIGLFFFYKICEKEFKNWKIGILGCIFLILSPRIFADSFYNPKDLPFLSLFIISTYTLITFLDRKNYKNAILHALACGLLIDIRVMGIILPFITILFYFLDIVINKDFKKNKKTFILNIVLYLILLTIFIILFWPFLWKNPIHNFILAFKNMSKYPWDGSNLYFGKFIKATELPWHYPIVWILITTPVLYILFFLIGIVSIIISFRNKTFKLIYNNKKNSFIFLLYFFIPLITVIVLKSTLYDGWRQLYFIYPAFILIAIIGFIALYNLIKNKLKNKTSRIFSTFFIIILTANFLNSTYFMIKNHPYQNVYFNEIFQNNMLFIKNNFELDYWGLSYRKELEYILKNDSRKIIKIKAANSPGISNSYILEKDERNRIIYVDDIKQADYFISNYRFHPKEYSFDDFYYESEFYSIKINGAKIAVVYKLSKNYNLIGNYFFQILNRKPTDNEIQYFANKLKNKEMNLSNFILFLFSSNEFKNRNLNNKDFIKVAYLALLNRVPDNNGFNNWLNLLNDGQSREFIIKHIMDSDEYKKLILEYNL